MWQQVVDLLVRVSVRIEQLRKPDRMEIGAEERQLWLGIGFRFAADASLDVFAGIDGREIEKRSPFVSSTDLDEVSRRLHVDE